VNGTREEAKKQVRETKTEQGGFEGLYKGKTVTRVSRPTL